MHHDLLLAGALHEGAVQVEKLNEVDAGAFPTAEGLPVARRRGDLGIYSFQGFK